MHLATKEKMGYEKLLNVSEITIVVGSLWWNFVYSMISSYVIVHVLSALPCILVSVHVY